MKCIHDHATLVYEKYFINVIPMHWLGLLSSCKIENKKVQDFNVCITALHLICPVSGLQLTEDLFYLKKKNCLCVFIDFLAIHVAVSVIHSLKNISNAANV